MDYADEAKSFYGSCPTRYYFTQFINLYIKQAIDIESDMCDNNNTWTEVLSKKRFKNSQLWRYQRPPRHIEQQFVIRNSNLNTKCLLVKFNIWKWSQTRKAEAPTNTRSTI